MVVTVTAAPEELAALLEAAKAQFPALAPLSRPRIGAKVEVDLEAPGGPYQLLIEVKGDGG